MRRLMRVATLSGRSRATSRAAWPTTASPSSMRTALGVSISPSRLRSVTDWPWSSRVAMAEKVVPRSMPTSLPAGTAMPTAFHRVPRPGDEPAGTVPAARAHQCLNCIPRAAAAKEQSGCDYPLLRDRLSHEDDLEVVAADA